MTEVVGFKRLLEIKTGFDNLKYNKHMKKVLFLFPPYVANAAKGPYLAPHLLSTLLRQKGHEVENIDLNVLFVIRICSIPMLDKIEAHLHSIPDHELDKETKYLAQGGLVHLDILRDKLRNDEFVALKEKITLAWYLEAIFLSKLKTIKDYRDNGLNVPGFMKDEFKAMVDELDIRDKTICISCAFGDQLTFTLELARLIKTKSPETPIILGGAQISLLPEELISDLSRFKLFNEVFTGFAEEKISDLVENCSSKFFSEPLSGTVATTKMLDSLPLVNFDGMNLYEKPLLPVMVNKGCYWGKCSFCDYILMGDLGGLRYISRSVEIVFNEIKSLRERYPDFGVNLISDAVPPKFYKELAIRANQEDFPLHTSSYMINNKNLTEDFFIEASKARIGTIVFGTESTNDRVLSLMKKQGRRQDILTNFRLAQRYGISIKVNLIPNYPTSTFQEAMQTVNDISFFQDSINKLAVFKFYLSANTQMDREPENYQLEIDNDIPYLKTKHNGFHSKEFSNKTGMSVEEEEKIYYVLKNIQSYCDLNPSRKIFREKVKTAGGNVKLNKDYKVIRDNDKTLVYSFRKGSSFSINEEDFKLLDDFKKGFISLEDIKHMLGANGPEWIERFFLYEIVEFAG